MSGNRTDLKSFNNDWYKPGAGSLTLLVWYFINVLFFKNGWFPFVAPKRILLRLFGAKIGKGVVIKPCVNIKYPWKLIIGDYTWIGENVWIDNLSEVKIGANACISQGALLLCGNHDYSKSTFDLMTQSIIIDDGVWIGANAVVCGGVTCHSHSVLAVQSVASKNLEDYTIYRGNPAQPVRKREIK
jgi:putative colanic acid biosynthesis acetyltransferase WcaF